MRNLFLKKRKFHTSLTSVYLECTVIALRKLTSLKITSKTSQVSPWNGLIMFIEMILGIKKFIEIKWNSIFSIKIIRLFFLKFWKRHLRQNSANTFTSKKAISWIKTFSNPQRGLTPRTAILLEIYTSLWSWKLWNATRRLDIICSLYSLQKISISEITLYMYLFAPKIFLLAKLTKR